MIGALIAGTASGVGKTTVSLAILAAARRRGIRMQPFKGGPDFLDTGHHTRIAGKIARNLDTWMLSAESNLSVVRGTVHDSDALLVEGMMGLFDGKSNDSDVGSSAEIAKLLKLPVILVLDASKSARSLAAVVFGFETFDRSLPLAGVILNRVSSERHFELLASAITNSCKTPVLGWLPREALITIPERHLGLRSADENGSRGKAELEIATLADLAEKHLNLDRILSLTCDLHLEVEAPTTKLHPSTAVRIGVARDEAFSFYYEDNLDLLRKEGATIVPFSPLRDVSLPPNLDAIYFGGGYPELHARQLSENESMQQAIRNFVAAGKPVYAECGGMIFLGQQLTDFDGTHYPMVGVLPLNIEMTPNLFQFGYVTVKLTHDCLLGPAGLIVRGHSFHYSRLSSIPEIQTKYRIEYSLSGKEELEGFSVANVLASYVHLHFRAAPTIARNFVETARNHRNPITSLGQAIDQAVIRP